MPDTETPFLKLVKPEIAGSASVWGNKLNTDMDKIDVGVQANHGTAGAALYRGRPLPDPDNETAEQKRTASQILLYADDVTLPGDRPGLIVSAAFVKSLINAVLPIGIVMQWSGSVASIPANWALCNGQTVNGNVTPNLVDKFVLAAGGATGPGATGGTSTHQHGYVTNGTALTKDQLPAVRPQIDAPGATGAVVARMTSGGVYGLNSVPGGPFGQAAMDHLGTGQPHNHNGVTDAGPNIPPFYAICFIMKIANV